MYNSPFGSPTVPNLVDWSNETNLCKIVAKSTTYKEVLNKLGLKDTNSANHMRLVYYIKKYKIQTTHFQKASGSKIWKNMTADKLTEIILKSQSAADVLRIIGLKPNGGNHHTIQKYIKKYNIDTTHFVKNFSLLRKNRNILPLKKILVENSTYEDTSALKKRLLKEGLIENKCRKCGNNGTWMEEPLTLQLEHKNGNRKDHRLKNLELLCPNCHTQTKTWGNKKRI